MNKKEIIKEVLKLEDGKSKMRRCDLLEALKIMALIEKETNGSVSKMIQRYARTVKK